MAIQVLGVATGILLARGLGAGDRGVFAAMVLWPTVMVTIGDLGLVQSFSYFTARDPGSGLSMIRLGRRAAALQAIYLIPGTLLVTWVGLTQVDARPLVAGFVLAAAFVPAALISRYVAAVFQGSLQIPQFYAVRLSMHVVIALALVLISIFGQMTVWTVVWSYVAGLAFMTTVSLLLPRVAFASDPPGSTSHPLRFHRNEFVAFGLRALPGSLYPVEALFLDQLIVGVFLGPHALGLYVSALAFTSLPRLVAYALSVTAMPTIARSRPDRQKALTVRLLLRTVVALIPVTGVLVVLMPTVLPFVYGADFADAVGPAQFLVLGSLAFGVRQVLGHCIRGAGRPGVVSLVETASWPLIIGVAASGALIGLEGVTAGLLLVQVMSLLLLAELFRRSGTAPASGSGTDADAS